MFCTRSPTQLIRERIPRPALLLNLGQNLRILEKEVFLTIKPPPINTSNPGRKKRKKKRTSSPTLSHYLPNHWQPGNKTLSPALTNVGTTRSSLSGAPGLMVITVASGSGLDVAEVGGNIPAAVFCIKVRIRPFIGNSGRKEGRKRDPRFLV